MELTQAEDNKKWWQEYTEELYKKYFHDPHSHDNVITQLEPDILKYEFKWALGSISTNKASGSDGIPVELFQILKDDACESAALIRPANLENSAVVTELEKVSFHSSPKECLYYCTIAFISHTSKVMLKILQARLQQYMNHELLDVQAGFRKGRGIRDKIANIPCIFEKAREFQDNIYFCFIDFAKAFDSVDHNKLKNSERDGNTRAPDLPLKKSVCRSESNS